MLSVKVNIQHRCKPETSIEMSIKIKLNLIPHHHQVMLTTQILLFLSPFVSIGKSSRLHSVYAQNWSKPVLAGQPTLAPWCVGVHKKMFEFVLASPAVLRVSCLSYLDDLWDEKQFKTVCSIFSNIGFFFFFFFFSAFFFSLIQ